MPGGELSETPSSLPELDAPAVPRISPTGIMEVQSVPASAPATHPDIVSPAEPARTGSRSIGLLLIVIAGVIVVLVLAVVFLGIPLLSSLHRPTPFAVSLDKATTDTLTAPSYASLMVSTGSSAETQNLVWEAPDRIGGYVDTGSGRFYVAVIGSTEYQSKQVSTRTGPGNLTFLKGPSQPASSYDPVQNYLAYVKRATGITRNGDVYSFSVTQQSQTAQFTVTVTGRYVSYLTLASSGMTIDLTVSSVGTAPPVRLPTGAKVTEVNGSGASG